MSKPDETWSDSAIECPYCGNEDSDDLPYDSTIENYECPSCSKHFDVAGNVSYSFTAVPIDEEDEPDRI